jgi:YVTN family beta-propeller protein
MKKSAGFVCAFTLIVTGFAAHAATSGYHLIKTIPIPGDWTWDYIGMDNTHRHVLVSHGPQLEILNADTYRIDGKIVAPDADFSKPETLAIMDVRGGAAAEDIGRGFIPNAHDGSVTVFDLNTLKVIATVKVGANPDGYLYDPATQRGFTFSNRTKGALAVDLRDPKLAGTVTLGSKPEGGAADGKGHIFVDMQEKDVVAKIDSRKLALEETWSTGPCKQPTSMAIDTKTNRLFIGCRGDTPMLVVMDSTNGKIVANLPIGMGTDATVFDAEKRLIFTSNGGDGTITVIQEESADKFTVIDTVKTEVGARTMTLDTKSHKLFLITADRTTPPVVAGQPPSPRVQTPGTFRVLVVGPQ